MKNQDLKPIRYLGLDLAGAKNEKTAITTIEFYPREKKVFLLDVYQKVTRHDEQSNDQALIELIQEITGECKLMGVNAPVTLPPCISCTRKTCPLPDKCTVPAVKAMRSIQKQALKSSDRSFRVRDFTPYTQRPIELWMKYQILPELGFHIDIDESMGANKAPLTARLHFLKRHFPNDLQLIETWPKLTMARIGPSLGIDRKVLEGYRSLEDGIQYREVILDVLSKSLGIFIYDRDFKKLAENLSALDALLCSLTALLSDHEFCLKPPRTFPEDSGWIAIPSLHETLLGERPTEN